jgi:hypothetical protein
MCYKEKVDWRCMTVFWMNSDMPTFVSYSQLASQDVYHCHTCGCIVIREHHMKTFYVDHNLDMVEGLKCQFASFVCKREWPAVVFITRTKRGKQCWSSDEFATCNREWGKRKASYEVGKHKQWDGILPVMERHILVGGVFVNTCQRCVSTHTVLCTQYATGRGVFVECVTLLCSTTGAGRFAVRTPLWARDFLLHTRPHPFWSPNQLPVQWIPALFPGEWTGRGVALATHSHPALRVKREYSCTSIPSLCEWMACYGEPLPLSVLLHCGVMWPLVASVYIPANLILVPCDHLSYKLRQFHFSSLWGNSLTKSKCSKI